MMSCTKRIGSAGGMTYSSEYTAWKGMVQRCHNPRNKGYVWYGDRGIRVADEWRGRGGFLRFFEHVGSKPSSEHSIDRINNDGHYKPGNVRWAPLSVQSLNRRTNTQVVIKGVTRTISEWAVLYGVTYNAMWGRLMRGDKSLKRLARSESPKSRMIRIRGKIQSLTAWAREIGIVPATFFQRLDEWPSHRWLDPPGRR